MVETDNTYKSFCLWFFSTPSKNIEDEIKHEPWKYYTETMQKKVDLFWTKLDVLREHIYDDIDECIDAEAEADDPDADDDESNIPIAFRGGSSLGLDVSPKYKLSSVNYCYNLIVETKIEPWLFFVYDYFSLAYCLSKYNIYSRFALRNLYNTPKHNTRQIKKTAELQIIDVVKIQTPDGFYAHYAVVKTYWLCLVQRHWKKLCLQRKQILAKRCLPREQRTREIYGAYSVGNRVWPTARGILSCYSRRLLPE